MMAEIKPRLLTVEKTAKYRIVEVKHSDPRGWAVAQVLGLPPGDCFEKIPNPDKASNGVLIWK